MENAIRIKPVPSSASPNASCSATLISTPPNPYARDPSRRAIACVTCAKAKTRCDKALPSCSRCVTKGLKCDPRSTRRTTDNNYRPLSSKRPFVMPKRFSSSGVLPSSDCSPSPRSIPSTKPRSIMRAPSHIDFRTAVKMSQQASIMSGVPRLTPLPTYQSHITDECYSYTPSPEPELRYTPDIEQDGFPFSRGATPQTPIDPFTYNEPLPLVDDLGYLDGQPWSRDGHVPVGLGFGDMEMSMPDDSWMTPEPDDTTQAKVFAQGFGEQGSFDTSLGALPVDWAAFQMPAQDDSVPASKDVNNGFDSGIAMQGEWTQPMPPRQDVFVDMSNMITSAPYVPKMQTISGYAPVWEDVFMSSSLPY